MKQVELTPAVRAFLKLLIPPDATLLSLAVGPHEMEIGYLMQGEHLVERWAAVSIQEVG